MGSLPGITPTEMPHPKLILFDLGNTLVDYHVGPSDEEKDLLGLQRVKGLLESWSAHVSLSDLRSRFYEPWLRVFPDRSKRDFEFPVVDFLRGLIAEHFLDNDHIHSIMLEFHTPTALHAKTAPGASPGLRALRERGVKLGVLSNSPVPGICHTHTLTHLSLSEFFDFQIYSYDHGLRKPNSKIFEKALDMAKSLADESVMVGDSPYLDLIPALGLGMRVIRFLPQSKNDALPCSEPHPRYLSDIRSIEEVDEILFKRPSVSLRSSSWKMG